MAELLNVTIGNAAITSYSGKSDSGDRKRLGNAEVTGTYGHYITCIEFTTNANGATNISFDLTHGWWWHSDGSSVQLHYDANGIATQYTATDGNKYSLVDSFKFAITTSSTALVSGTDKLYSDPLSKFDECLETSGYIIKHQPVVIRSAAGRAENNGHVTTTAEAKYIASYTGSCDVLLEPNKTYYIWLYSNFDQYKDDNIWSDITFLRQVLFTGWGHNGYAIVNSEGNYYATITFNDNGGTGGPGTQVVAKGQPFTLSSTKPTKANTNGFVVTLNANGGTVSPTSLTASDSYTFSAWNSLQNGSGASFTSGGTNVVCNADITLYAQYTKTNGSVTLPTPSRTGYNFKGWATTATAIGGTTGKYTPSKNITLYASWEIKTYTLTLNKSTGVATFTGAGTYNYATEASTTATAATGYHLTKYAGTLYDGSGTDEWPLNTTNTTPVADSNTWSMYANRTITAYATANTYTVTYDSNGGTGSMANSLATYNANFLTTENGYQKTGYQFNGWNEAADGTGTPWTLQSLGVYEHGLPWPWTYTYDITLYAQWDPNTYYIKYDPNGGTGSMANSTHRYGIFSNLTKNTFSKAGYKFKGWATSSTATSAIYNDEHSIATLTTVNQETITLYAVWAQDVFTITTGAEGSYIATVNGGGNYSYGDTCTIEAIYPEGCGYEFDYFIKDDITTITTNPYNEAVTAEAHFIAYSKPIQYIISFNSNTGNGSMSSMICAYDADYPLTSNAFHKDGYQFIGWATSPNATTVVYENGQVIRNLASSNGSIITLYAVWKAISKVYIWAANAAGEYGWRKALKYIYNTQITSTNTTININTTAMSDVNYSWSLASGTSIIASGSYSDGSKNIPIDKAILDMGTVYFTVDKMNALDTITVIDQNGNILNAANDNDTATSYLLTTNITTVKVVYETGYYVLSLTSSGENFSWSIKGSMVIANGTGAGAVLISTNISHIQITLNYADGYTYTITESGNISVQNTVIENNKYIITCTISGDAVVDINLEIESITSNLLDEGLLDVMQIF